MYYYKKWAIVVPMANEEADFEPFIDMLNFVMDELNPGNVYFVIDKASKDRTLELCQELSQRDERFVTVWAPENKNVVDAYVRGLREARRRTRGHRLRARFLRLTTRDLRLTTPPCYNAYGAKRRSEVGRTL